MVSKSKKIIRVRKSTTFTTVLSEPLLDKRLSLSAKGLYSVMEACCTFDDGATIYIDESELESSLEQLIRYSYVDNKIANEFKSKFVITGKFNGF